MQEIQELQEKVAAMGSEASPLEAARGELAACEGDRQKFLRLLEQLQVLCPQLLCSPNPEDGWLLFNMITA